MLVHVDYLHLGKSLTQPVISLNLMHGGQIILGESIYQKVSLLPRFFFFLEYGFV